MNSNQLDITLVEFKRIIHCIFESSTIDSENLKTAITAAKAQFNHAKNT